VNGPLTPRLALLLTLPPLLWAGNAVVGRLMVGQVPPLTFLPRHDTAGQSPFGLST